MNPTAPPPSLPDGPPAITPLLPMPSAAGRIASLDLVRFAAAFGIVWAHAHAPGQKLGYLALALFLVLTGFLSIRSLERSRGGFSFALRAQRIAVPWLFWSLVFLAGDRLMFPDAPPLPFLTEWNWWLVGPSIHLWFLPFMMLTALLLPPIFALVRTPGTLRVACAALVVLSLPLAWLHGFADLPVPFAQWCFSLPLLLYGALAAVAHRLGVIWLPLAAAAVASTLAFAMAPDLWAVQMILAGLLFEALWRVRGASPLLARFGGTAFGIYLVHPMFLLVAYKLLGGGAPTPVIAVLTFLLSMAFTLALKRVPGLRRVV